MVGSPMPGDQLKCIMNYLQPHPVYAHSNLRKNASFTQMCCHLSKDLNIIREKVEIITRELTLDIGPIRDLNILTMRL